MDTQEFEPSLRLELGKIEDLPKVFHCLEEQFPPDEFYDFNRMQKMMNLKYYKILLFKENDNLIGYATVCSIPDCEVLWLDLLAILPEYQNKGYGAKLFNALFQKYCGPYNGILFSAERVTSSDPDAASQQKRRLEFYERLGTFRLTTDFVLPTKDGGLPMYLYFKPHKGIYHLTRKHQAEILAQMFDYCYAHIKDHAKLLTHFKSTMQDEVFNEGKRPKLT